MKVAAVIAEYNPFHNGHALHLEMTREMTGASHVAAVMSGDFVQRGDVACMDKRSRAIAAVKGGADLVLELPLPWAMAGAETFARGGVGIAAALGCVEVLSFGSECGKIELIAETARLLDSDEARQTLRGKLEEGKSYAAARALSLYELSPACAELLSSPNDTLGVEYCRALNKYAPEIVPFCVRRLGAEHDQMAPEDKGLPVSASYLRMLLKRFAVFNDATAGFEAFVPPGSLQAIQQAENEGRLMPEISRLDRALLMKLRRMTAEELAALPDVGEGLEHRIADCAARASGADAGFASLCDSIRSRRYTHARVRRILLSALLGVTAADSEGLPPYIRVLAMNSRGKEILAASAAARGESGLPVISRYAQVSELDDRGKRIFRLGSDAADTMGLMLREITPSGSDMAYRLPVED